MSINPKTAFLAEKYKADPTPLQQAVLGKGDINPYEALGALQMQEMAKKYEMMQNATQGQQAANQPSIAQQAVQQAASQPRGIESMPVPEQNFAYGGIVAMADGGDVPRFANRGAVQDNSYEGIMSRFGTGEGQTYTPPTQEQTIQSIQAAQPAVKQMMGPSLLEPFAKQNEEESKELAKGMSPLEIAAALFSGAAEAQEGPNALRGVSKGFKALGAGLVDAERKNKEAKRLLRQSQIQLASAEQARNDNQFGVAEKLAQSAEANKLKGIELNRDVEKAKLTAATNIKHALISKEATLAAHQNTDFKSLQQDLYRAAVEGGAPANAATMSKAGKEAADAMGRYPGSARIEAAEEKTIAPQVELALMQRKDYQKALKAGDMAEASRIRNEVLGAFKPQKATAAPQAAPTQGAPIKVTSPDQFAKLPSGTTFVAPDGSVRVKP
jgi:hypothetical protein